MSRCASCARENPPQFLTVEEVAPLLRVSMMTVYRLIKSGELKSVRIGRGVRIHANEYDRYLKHITAA